MSTDIVGMLGEAGCVGDEVLGVIRDGLGCYDSIAASLDNTNNNVNRVCPVATKAGVSSAPAEEHDFTTIGRQGHLRCPFAESDAKSKGDACGHDGDEGLDPIKAAQNTRSNQSVSASSSNGPARCPIRYMDQHSPEEVAEFVEKHKNELPRSHTVCVQRYQRDSLSMRKLDAKYGSLISMIRGLGEKHQAFLPGREEEFHASRSVEHVGKWAEDVSSRSSLRQATPEDEMAVEPREGHFQRPLREIRVGESPSRPWGIHVPLAPEPVPKQDGDEPLSNLPPMQKDESRSKPEARCPFGRGAADASANAHSVEEGVQGKEGKTTMKDQAAASSRIIFNGPVYISSPETAMTFLQQMRSF